MHYIAPTEPDPQSREVARGMNDVGELVDYFMDLDKSGISRQAVVTKGVSTAMAYFEMHKEEFEAYKAMINARENEFSNDLAFLLRATIR